MCIILQNIWKYGAFKCERVRKLPAFSSHILSLNLKTEENNKDVKTKEKWI